MRNLLSLCLLTAVLPAVAGPNAAVHCKAAEGNSSFTAFDLALRGDFHIASLHGMLPFAGESLQFSIEDRKLKAKLEQLDDKAAVVSYLGDHGKHETLTIVDRPDGDPLHNKSFGELEQITYFNASPAMTNQHRLGSVLIEFKGTPMQLYFADCSYEGALVDNWKSIWH